MHRRHQLFKQQIRLSASARALWATSKVAHHKGCFIFPQSSIRILHLHHTVLRSGSAPPNQRTQHKLAVCNQQRTIVLFYKLSTSFPSVLDLEKVFFVSSTWDTTAQEQKTGQKHTVGIQNQALTIRLTSSRFKRQWAGTMRCESRSMSTIQLSVWQVE